MTPVLPIDLTSIIAIVMGMLVVLIPVAGLTARFALKPVVEALARYRESQNAGQHVALLERRVALLEQQTQALESGFERLSDDRDFQRQLSEPKG